MSLEEVRIMLPSFLAKWLEEFSKALAMTPGQFLANLLSYYYEAWKIGAEGRVKLENILKPISRLEITSLLNEFLQTDQTLKDKFLVQHFCMWIKEQGLTPNDIDEGVADRFIKEYGSNKKLKPTTMAVYKFQLKRFVRFVKSRVIET